MRTPFKPLALLVSNVCYNLHLYSLARERDEKRAKLDDERQYGKWGVDGIRQRSASFAAMVRRCDLALKSPPGFDQKIDTEKG